MHDLTDAPQGSEQPHETCFHQDARRLVRRFIHGVLQAQRGEVPAEHAIDLPKLRVARAIFCEMGYHGLDVEEVDYLREWLSYSIVVFEKAQGRAPVCHDPDHLSSPAEVALRIALRCYPHLTANGLYSSGPCDPPDVDQIATAIAFIAECDWTARAGTNSYAAKHWAERWGDEHGLSSYVSNGAVIAAALYHGVRVKPCGSKNPNAMLGLRRGRVR